MDLLEKIRQRKAIVGVIGLGYAGLPLVIEFGKAGFRVIGFDLDEKRVAAINAGKSYIDDIDASEVADLVAGGRISATTDFSALREIDAVTICVPTPLSKTRDPDVSYIVEATNSIAHHLHPVQLIVLESTTYPGTTDELILSRLEETGMKLDQDFYLAFAPERVDPGNEKFSTRNTPKLVGGVSAKSLEHAAALYETSIATVVPLSSARAAEMSKLLENTFRAVNVALVNEMAIMAEKLGVDIWEVIDGASTKPFGFMPFYPGPGLGGHCIPVDPYYLSWKMKTLNYNARFIQLAGEINAGMPEHVVERVAEALNERCKSVKGSHILVMGVTYKENVADVRESPALDIIDLLELRGADVVYTDPYVPCLSRESNTLQSVALTPQLLISTDCTVIAANHHQFDWEMVTKHASLIVDCRNATRNVKSPKAAIVRL